ncbi:MAG TPA: hypothetical protein VFU82_04705 [Gammaproteobacteria bacterium]|nr:hypothetical protein [Gammaproteobacteria bacterium]
MKVERIMSFQVSKKLDDVSVEKVSGGSAEANFNFPQPTFHYNSGSGFSMTLDS